jgi:DNA polymerase-3 subunit epsilon/CBS domain-containing protein
MPDISNATPLIALDAAVIDTETTSLDPARARIVEIAAVRLVRGRIASEKPFHRLVRPDEPVPAAAVAVHHIDDGKLAYAPAFREVWPDLLTFIGGVVVIGHTVGFDFAVLKQECERASVPFRRPRMLDTRLLAHVVEPNLASFTLEALSSWLGVEIKDRHSALGDALTTGRLFCALLPKLRESGIRTLGEATEACRALTKVLDEQHRAGWIEAAPARAGAERTLSRIDSYPYRHRVRDVMRVPAKFVTPGTALHEALRRLMDERVSSLYICPAQKDRSSPSASETGIITERDVLRAVADHGGAALTMPVEHLMSKPMAAIAADDFVYRAIARMSRLKVRHLGVVDETGGIIGALSARDLLRLRASEAVALGDELDNAHDIPALGSAWANLPAVVASLLAEAVSANDVAAVISHELGALTRQAAVIAESRMRDTGRGGPMCPYAVAVLGSAGRGESGLAMDQDNALVFADGAPGGAEDQWFSELAVHIADILHEVGVPYCKGGVMARNPQWRGSLATWRERIGGWIGRTNPQDLLSVDIFFDMRAVQGDAGLCANIWRYAFDIARDQTVFAKLLVEAAGTVERGLGLFGGFRTTEGRIDLKKTGLFGIVTAARALAIRHHLLEHSTRARLIGIKTLAIGAAGDLDALIAAQETLLDLLLAQQVEDLECGRPPSNAVAVKRLSARDRERLRSALEVVGNLDEITRDLLF